MCELQSIQLRSDDTVFMREFFWKKFFQSFDILQQFFRLIRSLDDDIPMLGEIRSREQKGMDQRM
jgi:hypothetical protein